MAKHHVDSYKPGASRSDTFTLKSGVALFGGFAGTESLRSERNPIANVTILSGDLNGDDNPADPFNSSLTDDNSYHVVTATSVTPPTGNLPNLDGVTIKGGHADSSGTQSAFGAGIYMETSSAVFRDCIIEWNHALTAAGGVYSDSGTLPVFRNCIIRNNLGGKLGGGIYMEDHGRILNCDIRDNSAGTGGGVYADSIDEAEFVSSRFSGNNATGSNVYGYDGGGMRIGGSGDVEITNCLFDNNGAGLGVGGGLYVGGVDLVMTNCTFTLNSADLAGGLFSDTTGAAVNCILWDDSATTSDPEIYDASSLSVTYSDVEGGWSGSGNINNNPTFVSGGNYRLRCGSPALNVGTNGAVPCDEFDVNEDGDDCLNSAQSTPDRDRKKRIANTTFDMGAFERISCEGDANADGHVDIDDLVLVVTNWGASGGPADVYPSQCSGNNTVDIDDLVKVITSWGDCEDAMPFDDGGIPTTFQDCWDKCSNNFETGSPEWQECMDSCVQALCELGLIEDCP